MSRRSRRKEKKDRQGFLLLGLCLLTIALAVYFYFEVKGDYVEREKLTNCRKDGIISVETAFVFDTTDGLSETQGILLKKKIGMLIESSAVDERITVYTLSETIGDFKPIFNVCNPGDGQNESEITSNKRKLLDTWKKNFVGKINDAMEGMTVKTSADYSPIMEMLKYVSVNTMLGSSAPKKRIIIASDMLHHTNKYSHYRDNISYKDIVETGYGVEVMPHLEGVHVSILYVVRSDTLNIQNRGHVRFWEEYTKSGGGSVISVETIN